MIVALLDDVRAYANLRRFALLLGMGLAVLVALVAVTPCRNGWMT